MRYIQQASLTPYILSSYKEKKGLILELTGAEGRFGYGDISPLAGWNVESFEDALLCANELISNLRQNFLPPFLLPSVSFAYQSALWQMEDPLTSSIHFTIPTLVHGDRLSESVLENTQNKRIKLKLGTLDLGSAIDLAKQLINNRCKIAIDLNRCWSLEKTVSFCKQFEKDAFIYIEEPCDDFTNLNAFYEKTHMPYALDESLWQQPLEVIQRLQGLSHIILKPTVIGGEKECSKIINYLPHTTPIFSSAYESEVGLLQIIRLSHKLSPNQPIGIGTFISTVSSESPLYEDFVSGTILPKSFSVCYSPYAFHGE